MLIGVLIAVGANTVIPIGLNLQKYAHRQAERQVEGACPSACIPLLNATRNVAACTAHGTHLSAGATVRQLSAHVEPPAVSPRPLHRASLPTCPCLVLFRLTLARAGSSSVVSCATAGQVATPFTSNPVWWAGLISMISGEVIPFHTKRSSPWIVRHTIAVALDVMLSVIFRLPYIRMPCAYARLSICWRTATRQLRWSHPLEPSASSLTVSRTRLAPYDFFI